MYLTPFFVKEVLLLNLNSNWKYMYKIRSEHKDITMMVKL